MPQPFNGFNKIHAKKGRASVRKTPTEQVRREYAEAVQLQKELFIELATMPSHKIISHWSRIRSLTMPEDRRTFLRTVLKRDIIPLLPKVRKDKTFTEINAALNWLSEEQLLSLLKKKETLPPKSFIDMLFEIKANYGSAQLPLDLGQHK